MIDETRYCAGNRFIKTHPGPKGYLIVSILDMLSIFKIRVRD